MCAGYSTRLVENKNGACVVGGVWTTQVRRSQRGAASRSLSVLVAFWACSKRFRGQTSKPPASASSSSSTGVYLVRDVRSVASAVVRLEQLRAAGVIMRSSFRPLARSWLSSHSILVINGKTCPARYVPALLSPL